MSTYDLKFVAEVSGVAAGLQKIPGMTEKAAAASALKQITANRAAAQKAKKDQEDAAKAAGSGWKNAFAGVAKIAGFGELAEKAGALSGGMSGAAAASGLAIAGVAALGVAALGAAAGAVKLTVAAGEAIKNIDRLRVTKIITAEQREQVEGANNAIDALGVAADAVTVSLAAGFAPAITNVATKIIELELFVSKVAATFDTGALSIASWTDLAAAAVIGGILPFVDGLMMFHRLVGTNTDEMEGFAQSLHDQAAAHGAAAFAITTDTEAQRESLKLSTDAPKLIEEVTQAKKRETQAYKDAAAARKKLAEEVAKAEEDLMVSRGESWMRYAKDQEAAELGAVAAHSAALALWDIGVANVQANESAAIEKTLKEREEGHAIIKAAMLDMANQALALGSQLADQQLTKHTDELARLREQRDTFIANQKAQGRMVDTSKSAYIKGIDDQIKAERKRALMAYVAQKALAISSIVQSAAQMAIALAANPAFIAVTGGVGTVPAAIGIAAGMGALQSAAVLATPPPKFARGGVLAEVEPGEGIATRRAMADPKLAKHLDDANMGVQSSGRDVTQVFLNDRLLLEILGRLARLKPGMFAGSFA